MLGFFSKIGHGFGKVGHAVGKVTGSGPVQAVAPFLGFLGPVGAVAGRLLGWHTIKNHLGGLGVGTIQQIVEAAGVRFFLGFGVTLYYTQPSVRSSINDLVKSVVAVLIP